MEDVHIVNQRVSRFPKPNNVSFLQSKCKPSWALITAVYPWSCPSPVEQLHSNHSRTGCALFPEEKIIERLDLFGLHENTSSDTVKQSSDPQVFVCRKVWSCGLYTHIVSIDLLSFLLKMKTFVQQFVYAVKNLATYY